MIHSLYPLKKFYMPYHVRHRSVGECFGRPVRHRFFSLGTTLEKMLRSVHRKLWAIQLSWKFEPKSPILTFFFTIWYVWPSEELVNKQYGSLVQPLLPGFYTSKLKGSRCHQYAAHKAHKKYISSHSTPTGNIYLYFRTFIHYRNTYNGSLHHIDKDSCRNRDPQCEIVRRKMRKTIHTQTYSPLVASTNSRRLHVLVPSVLSHALAMLAPTIAAIPTPAVRAEATPHPCIAVHARVIVRACHEAVAFAAHVELKARWDTDGRHGSGYIKTSHSNKYSKYTESRFPSYMRNVGPRGSRRVTFLPRIKHHAIHLL